MYTFERTETHMMIQDEGDGEGVILPIGDDEKAVRFLDELVWRVNHEVYYAKQKAWFIILGATLFTFLTGFVIGWLMFAG